MHSTGSVQKLKQTETHKYRININTAHMHRQKQREIYRHNNTASKGVKFVAKMRWRKVNLNTLSDIYFE